jgi:hypothetical protein
MEKRLVRSGEVIIKAAKGMKPGRVMVIANGDIVYEAKHGGPDFVRILRETEGAYGYVAPDVKRIIDHNIERMKREEEHGKPYNPAAKGR